MWVEYVVDQSQIRDEESEVYPGFKGHEQDMNRTWVPEYQRPYLGPRMGTTQPSTTITTNK